MTPFALNDELPLDTDESDGAPEANSWKQAQTPNREIVTARLVATSLGMAVSLVIHRRGGH